MSLSLSFTIEQPVRSRPRAAVATGDVLCSLAAVCTISVVSAAEITTAPSEVIHLIILSLLIFPLPYYIYFSL